jgi:hypothetical protein
MRFKSKIQIPPFFPARSCRQSDGLHEGAQPAGGVGDHEGGRAGRYRRGLPEVCRRHQGASAPHEKPGEHLGSGKWQIPRFLAELEFGRENGK